MMRLLLILSLLVKVLALAPPHPDAEEEVHEMHRFLKGNSPTTQLVNAELCRGLTEVECMQLDRNFQRQARKLREIYQTTGYLKVLVICVRFSDHADRELPTPEQYDILFNSPAPDADLAPADHADRGLLTPEKYFNSSDPDLASTGSVKQFLEHNSQGALEVDFDIMPWKTTNNTEAYYSFGISGITRRFGVSAHSVMDQLEADGVDFSNYDLNNDGKIDALILLHSGFQAEIGGQDCYNTNAGKAQRIWSHAISDPTDAWESATSGMAIDNYAVGGGLRGLCNNQVPTIGVIAHEFIHNLGLPDLNDNSSAELRGRGVGHYSIMGNPYGVNNLADRPCHLTPYEKIFLGWLDPIEIDTNGRYSLQDSETSVDVYIIKHNQFSEGEYLLIENRQPKLFDELLWNGGLLIWHIDDEKRWMYERGWPGQQAWPSNNNHYRIALLPADRKYGLETGENFGDDGDFWRDGMEIGPGPVEAAATDNGIYPNTNTYRRGLIMQSDIRIYDISESADTMSFSIEGFAKGEPAAPPTSLSTPSPSVPPPIPLPTSPPTLPPPTLLPTSGPTSTPPPTVPPPLLTSGPTLPPAPLPTQLPTPGPTLPPTQLPTPGPSLPPTPLPTQLPTPGPTLPPTQLPSPGPSLPPTPLPTPGPTLPPTPLPTQLPTPGPTLPPTPQPTPGPTLPPTPLPTTTEPSNIPSYSPSYKPSASPTNSPSMTASPTTRDSNNFDRTSEADGESLQPTSPTSDSYRSVVSFAASLLLLCVVVVL